MAAAVRDCPDKENAAPPDNPVADVLRTARNAMAAHVDGSARSSGKRSRGPRSSDAQKVESVFACIDRIESLFGLTEDLRLFLDAMSNSNASHGSLRPAINALEFISSAGKDQIVRLRSATNNTSAKKQAAQAHSKLTKIERWKVSNDQMQRRAFASLNPKKLLQIAIKNVKQQLEASQKSTSVSPDLPNEETVAPRSKRQQLSPPGVEVLSKEAKRDKIYRDIRLPRPSNGNLIYSVAETISIVNALEKSNTKHPPRLYLALIKEKMISEKRVPVKR